MGLRNTNHHTPPAAPRVLLVEDNVPLAEATAEFLRSEGLEVRVVSTGGDALISVVEFRPDIVLCDLRLPDMLGFELAVVLRQNSATRKALFVIHTAFRETDIESANVREVDLVLSKPMDHEKLERLLKSWQTL